MSNQQYRKEEPAQPTWAERLKAARAKLEAYSARDKECAERVAKWVNTRFTEWGGRQINSMIEGMELVVQEGKIYRRQWIEYEDGCKEFLAGRLERQPREPQKAAISGATMVSATRQMVALLERKEKLLEEVYIIVGEALEKVLDQQEKKKAEKGETPPPEPPRNQPPVDKEATPPKEGKRAATAAA